MEAPVREEDGESENDFCGCGLDYNNKKRAEKKEKGLKTRDVRWVIKL